MNRPTVVLDGVTLPPLAQDGLEVTAEKIWSQNAGRSTSTGDFSGDIIAVKYTVRLAFGRLSTEQFRTLWGLVSGVTAFHTLKFPLPQANGANDKTIRCYSVSPTGNLHHWESDSGEVYYDGFGIECIGK